MEKNGFKEVQWRGHKTDKMKKKSVNFAFRSILFAYPTDDVLYPQAVMIVLPHITYICQNIMLTYTTNTTFYD